MSSNAKTSKPKSTGASKAVTKPAVVKLNNAQVVSNPLRGSQPRRQHQGTGNLSTAVRSYAAAVVDPWNGPLVGLPSAFPPIPTYKARVWARINFAQGTTSGFLVMNPAAMAVNDGAFLRYTSNGYAGSVISLAAVGVYNLNTNAPYATASMAGTPDSVGFRIVSAGFKITPVMKELDVGGEVALLRHPENLSLAGYDFNNLLAYDTSTRVAINSNRSSMYNMYQPVNPGDVDFSYSLAASPSNNFCMGALVTGGTAGNGFSVECCAIIEYAGRNVPSKSFSEGDPEGFSAVLTSLNEESSTWAGSLAAHAGRVLSNAFSIIGESSGPVLRTLATHGAREGARYLHEKFLSQGKPHLSLMSRLSANSRHGMEPVYDIVDSRRIERDLAELMLERGGRPSGPIIIEEDRVLAELGGVKSPPKLGPSDQLFAVIYKDGRTLKKGYLIQLKGRTLFVYHDRNLAFERGSIGLGATFHILNLDLTSLRIVSENTKVSGDVYVVTGDVLMDFGVLSLSDFANTLHDLVPSGTKLDLDLFARC